MWLVHRAASPSPMRSAYQRSMIGCRIGSNSSDLHESDEAMVTGSEAALSATERTERVERLESGTCSADAVIRPPHGAEDAVAWCRGAERRGVARGVAVVGRECEGDGSVMRPAGRGIGRAEGGIEGKRVAGWLDRVECLPSALPPSTLPTAFASAFACAFACAFAARSAARCARLVPPLAVVVSPAQLAA